MSVLITPEALDDAPSYRPKPSHLLDDNAEQILCEALVALRRVKLEALAVVNCPTFTAKDFGVDVIDALLCKLCGEDVLTRAQAVLDGTHDDIDFADVQAYCGLDDSFVGWTPKLFAPYVNDYVTR